jgi:hypothetical protein
MAVCSIEFQCLGVPFAGLRSCLRALCICFFSTTVKQAFESRLGKILLPRQGEIGVAFAGSHDKKSAQEVEEGPDQSRNNPSPDGEDDLDRSRIDRNSPTLEEEDDLDRSRIDRNNPSLEEEDDLDRSRIDRNRPNPNLPVAGERDGFPKNEDANSDGSPRMGHDGAGNIVPCEKDKVVPQLTFDEVCNFALDNYYNVPYPSYENIEVWDDTSQKRVRWATLSPDKKLKLFRQGGVGSSERQTIQRIDVGIQTGYAVESQEIQLAIRQHIVARPGDVSTVHGMGHAVRAAIYVKGVAALYKELFPAFATLSDDEISDATIAAMFHDSGRQADGVDVFDELSAQNAENYLRRKGYPEARCKRVGDAIRNKDSSDPNKDLLAVLVHECDCLEYMRLGRENFDPKFLDVCSRKFPLSAGYDQNTMQHCVQQLCARVADCIVRTARSNITDIAPFHKAVSDVGLTPEAMRKLANDMAEAFPSQQAAREMQSTRGAVIGQSFAKNREAMRAMLQNGQCDQLLATMETGIHSVYASRTLGLSRQQLVQMLSTYEGTRRLPKSIPVLPGRDAFDGYGSGVFGAILLTLSSMGFSEDEVRGMLTSMGFKKNEVDLGMQLIASASRMDLLGDMTGKTVDQMVDLLTAYAQTTGVDIGVIHGIWEAMFAAKANVSATDLNSFGVKLESGRIVKHSKLIEIENAIAIRTLAVQDIEKLPGDQKQFIYACVVQRIKDGEKISWAWTIASHMAFFYSQNLHKIINPNKIFNEQTEKKPWVEFSDVFLEKEEFIRWRMSMEESLNLLMHSRGGSLKWIHDWHRGQSSDSFSQISCAAKSIFFRNRVDGTNQDGRYYLRSYTPQMLNLQLSMLINSYNMMNIPITDKVIETSLALYLAFTSIALHEIAHPQINGMVCTVTRGMQRGSLPITMQAAQPGSTITLPSNGISDSVSLEREPPPPFGDETCGYTTMEIQVPITRISSAYFLSTEFADRNVYRYQREMLADLSRLPATVKKQGWPNPSRFVGAQAIPPGMHFLRLDKSLSVPMPVPAQLPFY